LKQELNKLQEVVEEQEKNRSVQEAPARQIVENVQPASAKLNIVSSEAAYRLLIESQSIIVIVHST
jgi:hypothetical protein